MGHPLLRLVDFADGWIWQKPLSKYKGVDLIPLDEFAPDKAALAELAANNPFSDEVGLSRAMTDTLWQARAKEIADIPTWAGWRDLLETDPCLFDR